MKPQIKIFTGDSVETEQAINKWLKRDGDKIDLQSLKITATRSERMLSVVVCYWEKTQDVGPVQ